MHRIDILNISHNDSKLPTSGRTPIILISAAPDSVNKDDLSPAVQFDIDDIDLIDWNLPQKESLYISRPALEKEIIDKLTLNNTAVLTASSDLKGTGTSALASHMLHNSTAEIKYWFSAESKQKLYEQYELFLIDCGLLHPEKLNKLAHHPERFTLVISAVKQYFKTYEDWLIVYDNANSYSDMVEFLPDTKADSENLGKIIITSDSKDWPTQFLVEITKMEEVEAMDLVTEIDGDHKYKELKNLVSALNYHPLAITLAASYMHELTITPTEFLFAYQNFNSTILKEESAHHPDAKLWISFSMNLEKVYESNPLAVALLLYCTYFNATDIPFTLLGFAHYQKSSWQIKHPKTIENALSLLKAYALIKETESGIYSIHPLFQQFLQTMIEPDVEIVILNAIMIGLGMDYTFARENDHLGGTHFRRLLWQFDKVYSLLQTERWQDELSHNASLYLEYANFLHSYALCLGKAGKIDKQKALLERSIAIHRTYYSEDNIDIGRLLNNLAIANKKLGHYEEAKAQYETVLRIMNTQHSKNHVEIGIAEYNLALVEVNLNNMGIALSLLHSAEHIFITQTVVGKPYLELCRKEIVEIEKKLAATATILLQSASKSEAPRKESTSRQLFP